MATEMYYAAGALAALVVGILTYVATRRRDVEDDRQKLFDDALALAEAHKDAWRKATDELEGLSQQVCLLTEEVEDLRESVRLGIREGEMWRGVATEIATEFHDEVGRFPLAWPKDQPLPVVP